MHLISKSSYIKGLQCLKALYLYKYQYSLKDETTDSLQKIFDTGHLVGKMAQDLYPGGINCGMEITGDAEESIKLTKEAIDNDCMIIYEASFKINDVLAIADIMIRKGNNWEIIEIKSSTSIKDYNYDDCSVQYFVISNCGYEIKDISIGYINNQYVRKGEIELNKYFIIKSVLEEVKNRQGKVNDKITEFRNMLLEKKEPVIDIGIHCSNPFDCDFIGHCWKHIPQYSVFNLSRIGKKAFELYYKGISEIKDIPNNFNLSKNQLIEKESSISGKDYINRSAINEYLKTFGYPLYFFDFETFNPAIPLWEGTRPYEMIPFQYSLYYKNSRDSEPEYSEYLSDGKSDPRQGLIKQFLKDTVRKGTILAYNVNFERTRLKELSNAFPEFSSEISKRSERLFDLMIPFANKYYYKPSMKGRYSIKAVLPAINPEFDYGDLQIQEGGAASSEFERMLYLEDENEIAVIRKNLLKYCKRDTFAMIVLLDELENII